MRIFKIIKRFVLVVHAVSIHICWPWSINNCHIYVANQYVYSKDIRYTQDVIKGGGVVTAVFQVQLHVLIDIAILVMVAVCGDVIQLTV